MIDEHDDQGQAKQTDDHKHAGVVGLMEPPELYRKELILALFKNLGVRRALHIAGDFRHDGVFPVFIQPFRPGHCHQNDKDEQGKPDDDGFAKLSFMILADDLVEIQHPKKRPDRHQHIGFRSDRIIREEAREKQEHCEGDQYEQAESADDAVLFDAFLSRSLEYGDRHKAVDHGGAECGGVHDPPDGRSSEERYRQGDNEHQKDGIDRNLFIAEGGNAPGQYAILGHGIAQAAQCAQHADQAGEHQRQ